MAKTINSPGFQITEFDRSQYNRTINNTLPKAPTCFIMGYADKGEDYVAQWINAKSTFQEYYGNPTNEQERYFYNGVLEVLYRGGICIASKIPYDNKAYNKFAYTDYKISKHSYTDFPENLSVLNQIADNFKDQKTILSIENVESNISSYIDFDSVLKYRSGEEYVEKNLIRFVDISRQRYSSCGIETIKDKSIDDAYTNDCLGIIPVIVTPFNGLIEQQIISSENKINSISKFDVCNYPDIDKTALSNIYANLQFSLSSDNFNDMTVSKIAENQFPTITWKDENILEPKTFKHVCVLVFKAYVDVANNGNINFSLLESHYGTLDKNEAAQNPQIQYINDEVNQNSLYINMFSNIDNNDIKSSDLVVLQNQTAVSLGFFDCQCKKIISSGDTVINHINKILNKLENKNQYQFDLVVDAGVTNIAQAAYNFEIELKRQQAIRNQAQTITDFNNVVISLDDDEIGNREITENTEIDIVENLPGLEQFGYNYWRKAITLLTNFCEITRKDCMFISDGPRGLCLNRNEKIVSGYSDNTFAKTIKPKLRYIKRINTSYGAGYCNWFKTTDEYSNRQFWIPPSVKAMSSMILCDTFYHRWDAPAGMIRGVVDNVVDIAFNPTQADSDDLYLAGWNYAISYPINGIVLEGQKTFQVEKTALDRINVRRLLLTVERQVQYFGKYFLYEQNTEYTRSRFTDQIDTYLKSVRDGGGIVEYAVKCDSENNPPETIDRNELHVKIAIKPVKTIEYIIMSFILTNQGANVQEELINANE